LKNKLHLQGLINLADNYAEDGGFQVVPGFNRHLTEWVLKNPKLRGRYDKYSTFIMFSSSDPCHQRSLRVTARAGSLVIWDQRNAHGSAPNNSNRIRYAQFLKLFPASPIDPQRAEARTIAVKAKVEKSGVEVTDLGEKLFGLKPW